MLTLVIFMVKKIDKSNDKIIYLIKTDTIVLLMEEKEPITNTHLRNFGINLIDSIGFGFLNVDRINFSIDDSTKIEYPRLWDDIYNNKPSHTGIYNQRLGMTEITPE